MTTHKSGDESGKALEVTPPVEPLVGRSITGGKIFTAIDENQVLYKPDIQFSGEPRRLTMAEFKDWMAPLPIGADIVTVVLGIDRVVTSMRSVVESYGALDYFACRTLTSMCPPSQRHLLLRAEEAPTWAEKRQIILSDKCTPEYFTMLENDLSQIAQEQTSNTEKIQRTISLLDQHETISRTLKRDTLSQNRCQDMIYNLFDTYSALILKQTVASGPQDFPRFLHEAFKLATFLDQRERNRTAPNALNIITKEAISTPTAVANDAVMAEIHTLKVMIVQMEERHKRQREEDNAGSGHNKVHMVVPHRMSRPLVCENCGKSGHVARDCRSKADNRNSQYQGGRYNGNQYNGSRQRCYHCGDRGHATQQCQYGRPVCFRCKSDQHPIARCPQSPNDFQYGQTQTTSDSKWNNSVSQIEVPPINIQSNALTAPTVCKYCEKVGHSIKDCPQFATITPPAHCAFCNDIAHQVEHCSEFNDFRKRNPEGARTVAKKLGF